MKKNIIALILLASNFAFSYTAEIRELNSKNKNILFTLSSEEKMVGSEKTILALIKSKDEVMVDQTAVIDASTAELISGSIDQRQTKEKGTVDVEGDKVKLTYRADGKALKKKELKKPERFLAPGNFDEWLTVHFEEFKKEKTISINFLVWERMEIYKFKLEYLGLTELGAQKAQQFKLSIDNALIATFIKPIYIWKTEDMKKILKFEGRVAVKQVKGRGLENLDGEVLYFHEVKAPQ
ncbi:MAG: hypothetical protein H7061_02410 [Bdellovibrionaceae bacterium]|nr:hypothetical protein [Bdellovibrio sp.]